MSYASVVTLVGTLLILVGIGWARVLPAALGTALVIASLGALVFS